MTDSTNNANFRPWSAATYQIEVEGRMLESWLDCFPVMDITKMERADKSVVTRMTGQVKDQSELSGMLNSLAELQLPILSVKKMTVD